MKRYIGIAALTALVAMAGAAVEPAEENEVDTLHMSVDAGVLVFDRVAASDALADWAETQGGYFTWKSEESVRIRVPDEAAARFREVLEEIGEAVIRYDQSTWDMREELLLSRSALEAREEVLAKNIAYLSSSDVEGTLELEKEIRRLMSEIDGYRGYLRRLEHDRVMATIQVALSFQQSTVPGSRPSNFPWINDVDFFSFMNASMHGGSAIGSLPIPVPEGFAEVDRKPDLLAMSPEGVRLRVRSVKNYPKQTLEFWSKALSSDLENRGYAPMDGPDIRDWDADDPFEDSLWAVPLGNEDYLYLVSLRLSGSDIEILEMAGPAEYAMEYLNE